MNTRKKRTVFVGGLDDRVTEELLQAAFIPFGDIKSVSIPKDFTSTASANIKDRRGTSQGNADKDGGSGTARGYGFVEYEEEDDAVSAIDNMNGSELFHRTINVYYARPMKTNRTKAIWANGAEGSVPGEEEHADEEGEEAREGGGSRG